MKGVPSARYSIRRAAAVARQKKPPGSRPAGQVINVINLPHNLSRTFSRLFGLPGCFQNPAPSGLVVATLPRAAFPGKCYIKTGGKNLMIVEKVPIQ
jgi:hypothetical protein